jgi:GGDEF domain-containing protein
MALEYDSHSKFEALAPVLEDYANWFGGIALCTAYLGEAGNPETIATPQSFQAWVESARQSEDFSSDIIESITKIHDDMLRTGSGILDHLKENKKPHLQDFVEFQNLYSSFLSRIRRMEKDSALEGSGIDETTGLRSVDVLESDMKKEMERLSRQGNPFSLVLTRIDRFAGYQEQDKALKIAVANIKQCMRSFDDAYYLGLGQFLISLKHADIIGAQAAVNRLQQLLKGDENNIEKLTMSYCMAEPISDDKIAPLVENMRQDLNEHLNDEDAVLKFIEMSPLERYVNSQN